MPVADQSAAVTREDALAFADEAFRNRDITFSHRDVADMTGALSTFLQRHRLGATAISSTEQSAATPWFAWPARKTWEEVRVRLRSRDGNEWEEIASDFEYWMQSADGEMCDDVVAFQIIGETPLGLASVLSASAEPRKDTVAFVQEWMMSGDHEPDQWHRDFAAAIDARRPTEQSIFDAINEDCGTDAAAWIIARLAAAATPTSESVPATNQAGEVERLRAQMYGILRGWNIGDFASRVCNVKGHGSLPADICEAELDAFGEALIAALATQPATSQEGEMEKVARICAAIGGGDPDEIVESANQLGEPIEVELWTMFQHEAHKILTALVTQPAASHEGGDYNGHRPNRYVPNLPAGSSLFAVNPSTAAWHYVNHAGTWQGMPSPLSVSGTGLDDYGYSQLWNAIAKATRIDGGIIAISVRDFRATLAATPTPPTLNSWANTPEAEHERILLMAEIELHLKSCRIFLTSREKMHPVGVDIHDELLAKVTAAIEATGSEKANG